MAGRLMRSPGADPAFRFHWAPPESRFFTPTHLGRSPTAGRGSSLPVARHTAPTMSQENVEVVRFDAFNRGGVDACPLARASGRPKSFGMSPQGVSPALVPIAATKRSGPFFDEDWFKTFPFEEWEAELEQVIAAGARVVAMSRQHGLARAAERWGSSSLRRSSPSAMDRSCGSRTTSTGKRPSEPPDSRSRRCHRRTWRSFNDL